MKLPDFTEFEPFNALRQQMGTDKLGFFELFDPKFHLTGDERSNLNRHGLVVNAAELHRLLDFTAVFKNSRVFVEGDASYHLCQCSIFPSQPTYRIATSMRALSKPKSVCRECLQTLQYKGFDAHKARKEAYSQQVFESFSLTKFWHQYPLYPVSEKRDLRKDIGKS